MIDWVAQQFKELSEFTPFPAGGQKWVFGAAHPQDGQVVLKLIKPTTDGERVRREVLAVRQVKSKRVPRIFEEGVLGQTPLGDGLIWLREQRIEGQNVRQVLGSGALPPAEVLQLGEHVLEALADVAQARIIHRDVKPENIVRCSDGSYWLLDFGIARHLDLSSLTATNALGGPGTLGYAPPEQYRNNKRELDGRADLFALGVTMIEAITGRHPFRHGARDAPEVIRRIETTPLVMPRLAWDHGNRFTDLLSACCQRRQDCRPSDAADALIWMREVRSALSTLAT